MPAFQFAETSAGPVRYVRAGEGPDVVLIHGAMASLEDMLLGPFEALTRSYRVTAIDRPGHGATPRQRLRGSLPDQVSRLREAVAAIGVHEPVLLGHSFGATVAMFWAIAHPEEIRGVVAISPLAFPEIRLEQWLFGPRALPGLGDLIAFGPCRLIDPALTPILWEAMFLPQRMPKRYRDLFPFSLEGGPAQMLALGEDAVLAGPDLLLLSKAYASCVSPVVVLAGLADIVASPFLHACPLTAALLKSRLRLLPGMGHMLHHFSVEAVCEAVDGVVAS